MSTVEDDFKPAGHEVLGTAPPAPPTEEIGEPPRPELTGSGYASGGPATGEMSGHFEWTKDYNDAVQDRQAEIFANKKAAQEQTADLGEEPPTPTPIDPPSVAPTEPTIDDPDKPEAKVVDLEAQNIDVAIEDEQTPAVPEPAITTPEQQDEAPLTFAWSREAGASQFLDHQDLKMENAEGTPAPSDDRADTKEKGDGELQMSFMSQLDHSHSH